MNFAPRLSTCSFAAGRTSVAVTKAPIRRAVAIACMPATPAPVTHSVALLAALLNTVVPGGAEYGIGNSGFLPAVGLDRHIGAEHFHLLDGFRRSGDPVFARVDLPRYGNAHSPASS